MRAEKMCSVPGMMANMASESDTTHLIVLTGVIGLGFSWHLMRQVAQVKLKIGDERFSVVEKGSKGDTDWEQTERLHELYEAISLGANSFLNAECTAARLTRPRRLTRSLTP